MKGKRAIPELIDDVIKFKEEASYERFLIFIMDDKFHAIIYPKEENKEKRLRK